MAEQETTSSNKPLFRKVSKKAKKASRIRERDDDDDDDEESTSKAIQSTKKKRKLLNAVLYKRGLDSRATLKADKEKVEEPKEEEATELKATELDRLRAFSGATGSSGDGGSGEGILQQKHKEALEDFIQQNLTKDDTEPPKKGKDEEKPKSTVNDLENKLYQELASTAEQLSGSAGMASDATVSKKEEGDVGAGGAMLGGTGIAEVLLPVDSRMETAKATEEARMQRQPRRSAGSSAVDASMLPASFSIGKGKKERRQRAIQATQKESDSTKPVASGLPASYSQNYSLHSQERRNAAQAAKAAEASTAAASSAAIGAVDDGRVGFEAARRFDMGDPSEGSSSAQQSKQSSDARVFKNFVKTQRERGF